MQIKDFEAEIEILSMAYPNVFPGDAKKRGAMVIIWYDHFRHIPKDLFAKASKWCREHERFLSIASLRGSIVEVANVPDAFAIRAELNERDDIEPSHPMARRIYDILELKWIDSILEDCAFEREYKRAREWWVKKITKPENVQLLTTNEWPRIEGSGRLPESPPFVGEDDGQIPEEISRTVRALGKKLSANN